ncbi:MAG TPA: formyltetrahydrofolate deformylase [Gammaproteobacteria bacterium]|nr:formyltetrahydrofolate deformylase [Gammaproteobacteria bacterium]HIL95027.1 formyltetrahydrofolate deformylase [Pseudomonadales bacterium]
MTSHAVLRITCPDRKGLVAATASFLARHNLNIIDAQQHTDVDERTFFHRIKIDLEHLSMTRSDLEESLAKECDAHSMIWSISYSDVKQQVAIFVSKYEHCLADLLLRYRLGELDCEVPLVISNHEKLRPSVEMFDIPFHVLKITPENKIEQEKTALKLMDRANVSLIVMARYMQILSPIMLEKYESRIINIHHSTLPAFLGARPYHQAHNRGVKLAGATAHYATLDLDEGPIISQGVTACTHTDTVADLIRKGRDIERTTLANAVRAHLEGRIFVHGRKTIVF